GRKFVRRVPTNSQIAESIMLIRRRSDIRPSEITPARVWHGRREFVQAALAAGLVGSTGRSRAAAPAGAKLVTRPGSYSTMEKPTPFEQVTNYCNFYEFGTDKEDPSRTAPTSLHPRPWKVAIEGEVRKPGTVDIDDLMKLAPLEDRVYRLRCVEAW